MASDVRARFGVSLEDPLRWGALISISLAVVLGSVAGDVIQTAGVPSIPTLVSNPIAVANDIGWLEPSLIEELNPGDAYGPDISLNATGSGMVVWTQSHGDPPANRVSVVGSPFESGYSRGVAFVEMDDVGDAWGPEVAVDRDGNAVAVWRRYDGFRSSIMANRYVPGVGWGISTTIGLGAGDVWDPHVAVDGSGNATAVWIQAGDIWANQYVVPSGWGTPTVLGGRAVGGFGARVASNDAGIAFAVWIQSNESRYNVWANRFVPGIGREPAVLVEGNITASARDPQIVVDTLGNAIALWTVYGSTTDMWSNRFEPGFGWGTPTLLETGSDPAILPHTSINDAGVAVVAWVQSQNVWANRFVPGIGWETETRIDAGVGNAYAPRVAVDVTGNATAVWQESANLYANRLVQEGGWGVPTRLGAGWGPDVAVDATGRAVAVWTARSSSSSGSLYTIESARFEARYGWMRLLSLNDGPISASGPDVAVGPAGNAVAVFAQGDGVRYRIYATDFTPKAGWAIPTRLDSASGNAVRPRVGMDGAGSAVAVWTQYDGGRPTLWGNRFVPASGWGLPRLIETVSGDVSDLQLAVDHDGNAIAVWVEFDGLRSNIRANRFVRAEGWGASASLETGIGSATHPRVGGDGLGDALVVWQQEDGVRSNIWANRYLPDQGWGKPQLIESSVADAAVPEVAVNVEGVAFAVWWQYSNIAVNRFVPGTGWGTATFIKSSSASASLPVVGVDASGNALAVWLESSQREPYSLWAKRFANGWDAEPSKLWTGGGYPTPPRLAMDKYGNAIVVWSVGVLGPCYSFVRGEIYASRFFADTGWRFPTEFETGENLSLDPKIALDGAGNAIALWVQDDGVRWNVGASRYIAGDGAPRLSLTAPTTTLGNSRIITVAGRTDPGANVTIDGMFTPVDSRGEFARTVTVTEGTHAFVIVARNLAGNARAVTVTVTVDATPPALSLTEPAPDTVTNIPTAIVAGTTEPGARLIINGALVAVEDGGGFTARVALTPGENTITATATDAAGNAASDSVTVTFVDPQAGLQQSITLLLVVVAALSVAIAVQFVLHWRLRKRTRERG